MKLNPEFSDEPVTHACDDYGGKLCKCSRCGIVEICTPMRDFYATDPGGLLVCETCFYVHFVAPALSK